MYATVVKLISVLFTLIASTVLPAKETGCRKVPIKDIYSATNNLNALNFIGEGTAGELLCKTYATGSCLINLDCMNQEWSQQHRYKRAKEVSKSATLKFRYQHH